MKRFCLILVSIIFLGIVHPVDAKTLSDREVFSLGISNFMKSYYRHPQPEKVKEIIISLDRSDFLKDAHGEWLVLTFFNCVFSQNPTYLKKWEKVIAQQSPRTREILTMAMTQKIEGIFKQAQILPNLNDMYWIAFFATGDTQYLVPLVNHLKYINTTQDVKLIATGTTARWSLCSNSREDTVVKKFLEEDQRTADPSLRKTIQHILKGDCVEMQQESRKIIKEQLAKGLWDDKNVKPTPPQF